ncbi:MAG: sulfatase [Verrucomicrobiota bacterium]
MNRIAGTTSPKTTLTDKPSQRDEQLGRGDRALDRAEAGSNKAKSRRRPNILFIIADDHATRALGCYDSSITITPHLDQLAREGLRFDRTFCVNSICTPSRASMFTGSYSHRNGAFDNYRKLTSNPPTFPRLLQQSGYRTTMIGKSFSPVGAEELKGFDHFSITPGATYIDPVMATRDGKRQVQKGYITDIITKQAVEWLQGRSGAEPWLLLVNHSAPHMPFTPPPGSNIFPESHRFPHPASFQDPDKNAAEKRPSAMTLEGLATLMKKHWSPPEDLRGDALKDWVYQQLMRSYLSTVAGLDDSVGQILSALEKTGQAENTLVVYTSDQGFFLGEHGWYDKRFMYEESIRMPLLVRWPGNIRAASTTDAMTLNVDLAPTFLALAGLPIPNEMQGESLVPVLLGQTPANWRQSFYYHYYEDRKESPLPVPRHYGLRTARHKLIRFYGQPDRWELYDLQNDPGELLNLIERPEAQTVRRELVEQLRRARQSLADGTGPDP